MASEKSTVMGWIDRRLPVTENLERHLTKHPVPKKVNFFYLFGALLMVVFMIQVVTGIWLMMFYTNTEDGAFASVEYILDSKFLKNFASVVFCASLSASSNASCASALNLSFRVLSCSSMVK